jgi:hypothetical protein
MNCPDLDTAAIYITRNEAVTGVNAARSEPMPREVNNTVTKYSAISGTLRARNGVHKSHKKIWLLGAVVVNSLLLAIIPNLKHIMGRVSCVYLSV